jgi:hypothetical protein
MNLTDPIPNYEYLLTVILPFDILIAFIIGIFYFWRYKKTKAGITLLWAFGFLGVGIGILINYLIKFIFYDYFITILPANWDYSLFNSIGMLIITYTLSLSTFYVEFFNKKTKKIGIIISSIIAITSLALLVFNSFVFFDEYNIAKMIIRILAIWVIIFFTYYSIHSKNYFILAVTIGLILATVSGILMTSFYGMVLGLIGNILQFCFYFSLAYGLSFTR